MVTTIYANDVARLEALRSLPLPCNEPGYVIPPALLTLVFIAFTINQWFAD